MSAWIELIKVNGQMLRLEKKSKELKRKAIIEMRELGYSYDNIAKILHTGKVTAIKTIRQNHYGKITEPEKEEVKK
jgi:transposase